MWGMNSAPVSGILEVNDYNKIFLKRLTDLEAKLCLECFCVIRYIVCVSLPSGTTVIDCTKYDPITSMFSIM